MAFTDQTALEKKIVRMAKGLTRFGVFNRILETGRLPHGTGYEQRAIVRMISELNDTCWAHCKLLEDRQNATTK